MFPLSASGIVDLGDLVGHDPRHLTTLLANGIERQRPSKLEVTSDGIYFEAGLLRLVWNTNVLLPFRSGRIWVTGGEDHVSVMYSLSFVQMAAAGTVLSLMLASMSAGSGWFRTGLVFLGAWLFLVACNYLIGVVRFRAFLREAAENTRTRSVPVERDS